MSTTYKCKGIINLYNKSKLKYNKSTSNPIGFIKENLYRQEDDIIYLYKFSNSNYLSLHNSENTIIKKINDPTKLSILWNTYGKKLKDTDRINYIIKELYKINMMHFDNKYIIDKGFIEKIVKKHNNILDILLIAIISITSKSKSISKQIILDLIAIIHSILNDDSVGISIGIDNIQPFVNKILMDINKSLSLKNFQNIII